MFMTVHNSTRDETRAADDVTGHTPSASPVRKKFVEPQLSHPVDVLEATSYLQAVDSGATGLLPND
jgi:hypothetical protein